MQTSFPYFDIIIFGVIAVFLILRLKNILGTKTDIDDQNINREQSSKKKFTNIVPLRKNVNETSSIEIQKIYKDHIIQKFIKIDIYNYKFKL